MNTDHLYHRESLSKAVYFFGSSLRNLSVLCVSCDSWQKTNRSDAEIAEVAQRLG